MPCQTLSFPCVACRAALTRLRAYCWNTIEDNDAIGPFVAGLNRHGHRRCRWGRPGYCDMTVDERALLALIAAAQRGNLEEVSARAAWLVLPQSLADVVELSLDVGAAFLCEGIDMTDCLRPCLPQGSITAQLELHVRAASHRNALHSASL